MSTGPESFRLEGKIVLVTGAARGIGASCASTLAAAGASVIVTDIDSAPGTALAQEIIASGGIAHFRELDVTQEARWCELIQEVIAEFGGLDVVVNNAGVELMGLVEETALEDWRTLMTVNSDAVFLGVKQAIRAMKPGGIAGQGGSIINIASITAMVAFQAAAAYCASKAAVTQLTKVAAMECGKLGYGIRVNSVHPGVILTELVQTGMQESVEKGIFASVAEAQETYASQHPIGHLGDPVDIANAVLYLASDASKFVTGSQLVVDGGFIAQ